MTNYCPICHRRAFPSRGHSARFQFLDDPDTDKPVAVIMRLGCGHDAWISRELRDRYGGKPTDPIMLARLTPIQNNQKDGNDS